MREKQPGAVARTFRAAIKLGDSYYTIEEQVTLPLDATDDQIQEAVQLGQRIHHAQAEAMQQQIALLAGTPEGSDGGVGGSTSNGYGTGAGPVARGIKNPGDPASDKQREFFDSL